MPVPARRPGSRTRRLTGLGAVPVLAVLAVLVVSAPADSAPGRLRAVTAVAAAELGQAMTLPRPQTPPAPAVPLDPLDAAAVQRSRAAAPEVERLLSRLATTIASGDGRAALVEFDALRSQLAVVQPRDGRLGFDQRANELRGRLQQLLSAPGA
ncbi:MAG: hypothetical protein JWL64_2304 [Frankiales bacterium]|nr:hypothetical protein [Frankiales bacterium]